MGAQIGIHNPQGKKVGKVTHTRNRELIFVAGNEQTVTDVAKHMERHAI